MPALIAVVQSGPAASGTGSVALTCAATHAGNPLAAVVVTPGTTGFTPPDGNWRPGKTIAAGPAGHAEIWYLEGKYNPGGITSVTFAGPAGVNCRGGLTELSVPAGYSVVLESAGQASGSGGTAMTLPSALGNAADCAAIMVFADFFTSATSGTWTHPAGATTLQSIGSAASNWYAAAVTDLAAGMQSFASGFSTAAGETGWCAALITLRAIQFSLAAIDGGEMLHVLAFDPTGQAVIAGGDVEGLWKSADFGDHWQSTLSGVTDNNWNSVASVAFSVLPGDPAGSVYALVGSNGSNGGLLVSADGGVTWSMRSTAVQGKGHQPGTPPAPSSTPGIADRWCGDMIAQDPGRGSLYCCDVNSGVKRSTSSPPGASWTTINSGLPASFYARGLVLNPASLKEGWICGWQYPAGAGNGGVWHCPDLTAATPAWTQLSGWQGTVCDLKVLGSWLYAACHEGGIYRAPVSGGALVSLNGSGAASPVLFGTNLSSWTLMTTAGVHGMTTAIFYDPATDGTNGIPASWPGSGGPIPAGVSTPICNFVPDISTTLAGSNDARIRTFLGGAPDGAWIMPYHEANGSGGLTGAQTQNLDNYLYPLVKSINPTLQYGRGLATSPVRTGQDPTPWITPGMDFYGMDGYQASDGTRTPQTVFGGTLSAILAAVGSSAKVAIIETGTAISGGVSAWFDAIQSYVLANSQIFCCQSFWDTGSNPSPGSTQNWASGFTAEMNKLSTAFAAANAGGGGGVPTNGPLWQSVDGYVSGSSHVVIIAGGPGNKLAGAANYQNLIKLTVTPAGAVTYADLTSNASINTATLPPDNRPYWLAGANYEAWLGGKVCENIHAWVNPADTQQIMAAGNGGCDRTNDGGAHWRHNVNGMAMFTPFDVLTDPNDPNHIVLCTGDHVIVDLAGDPYGMTGVTTDNPGPVGSESHVGAFDGTDNPSTLYVGINKKFGGSGGGSAWWRQADQPHGPWTEIGFTTAAAGAACIGIYAGRDGSGNRYVLAVGQGKGLYRGVHSGTWPGGTWTWTLASPAIGTSGTSGQNIPIISKSVSNSVIYLFDRKVGVFRSNDFGVSWTFIWPKVISGTASFGWMALNPNVAGELWVSTTDANGLWKLSGAAAGTVSSGQVTATNITTAVPNPFGIAFYNGVLYVVAKTAGGVNQLWSFDGTTWANAGTPEIGQYAQNVKKLVITTAGVAIFSTSFNDAVVGSLAPVTAPPLSVQTTTLPNGQAGVAYPGALAAAGGTLTGYSWALITGSLSGSGLTLNADGSFSGTSVAGTYGPLTFRVTDSGGHTATSGSLSIVIAAALRITTPSLPDGQVGAAYGPGGAGVQLASFGGSGGGYTYALNTGSALLPASLSLSAGGLISGTITASGTTSLEFKVTDSLANTATMTLIIAVPAPSLAVTTMFIPPATEGVAFSFTLGADGGVPGAGYTWAAIDPDTGAPASLPGGLAFSTAGVLSGTPATAGSGTVTFQVTDSTGNTALATLTIVVQPAPAGGTTAAEILIPAGGTWVPPVPESVAGSTWQPDGVWAISAGGIWGGPGTGTAGGTYPATYGPVY